MTGAAADFAPTSAKSVNYPPKMLLLKQAGADDVSLTFRFLLITLQAYWALAYRTRQEAKMPCTGVLGVLLGL